MFNTKSYLSLLNLKDNEEKPQCDTDYYEMLAELKLSPVTSVRRIKHHDDHKIHKDTVLLLGIIDGTEVPICSYWLDEIHLEDVELIGKSLAQINDYFCSLENHHGMEKL